MTKRHAAFKQAIGAYLDHVQDCPLCIGLRKGAEAIGQRLPVCPAGQRLADNGLKELKAIPVSADVLPFRPKGEAHGS